MNRLIALALALSLLPLAIAKRKHHEKTYQEAFAKLVEGKTEVRMDDGTRCDIVTKTHAIEVDFADKWGEAIGQSLNYGFQTNLKPGILLILEEPEDYRHFIRINSLIAAYKLPIEVWTIDGEFTARFANQMDHSNISE